ncbi:MAG: DUF547 domain-containing protein [Bdellovibrionales bacterium]|nr:DUF547 domain-containing protein [Bdellovibrionales bacterium]
MRIMIFFCLFSLGMPYSSFGADKGSPTDKAEAFDHTHALFTDVLKNFVVTKDHKSEVNYKALKENAQGLNEYLHSLSEIKRETLQTWSKNQKMAFYINAYNAFTLKLLIDHYPVKSIKDIGSFFSSPWKKEFISLFGKKVHLDHIEHDILRKEFSEPRVHFAVNCASIGCPALRDEAYTAEALEKQLDEQARLFLNDSSRNRVDIKDKTLYLSKIFKWFKEDFEKNGMTIPKFIKPFFSKLDPKIDLNTFKIEYTNYDWSLNEIKE